MQIIPKHHGTRIKREKNSNESSYAAKNKHICFHFSFSFSLPPPSLSFSLSPDFLWIFSWRYSAFACYSLWLCQWTARRRGKSYGAIRWRSHPLATPSAAPLCGTEDIHTHTHIHAILHVPLIHCNARAFRDFPDSVKNEHNEDW